MFRKLFNGIVIFICIFFVFVAGIFAYAQYVELEELKTIEAEIQSKIDEEKEEQGELSLEMEYNLTDAYVEKVAREKLGLVKGEEIIYIENTK